jgi:hypothetical protein
MVSQLEFQPGAALMLGQLHGSILVERVLKISYDSSDSHIQWGSKAKAGVVQPRLFASLTWWAM